MEIFVRNILYKYSVEIFIINFLYAVYLLYSPTTLPCASTTIVSSTTLSFSCSSVFVFVGLVEVVSADGVLLGFEFRQPISVSEFVCL